MCLAPLTIRNPRKDFVRGIDATHIVVPCGVCTECRQAKQDNYYVRCFFEHRRTIKSGGFTQFFTLTYNETHLPTCTSHNIPCFRRRDITLFIKRLREYVGYNNKYFICCEYGDENHRPHYHGLFFVNDEVSPAYFRSCILRAWTSVNLNTKQHTYSVSRNNGLVYFSRLNSGCIIHSDGISYCCKYSTKDVFSQPWYNRLNNSLRCKAFDSNGHVKDSSALKDYKEFCQTRPFISISHGVGDYLLERFPDGSYVNPEMSEKVLLSGYISLPDSKKVLHSFHLPIYIERKALCRTIPHFRPDGSRAGSTFVYTDYGISIQQQRLQYRIDAFLFHCRKLSSLSQSLFMRAFQGTSFTIEYFRKTFNSFTHDDIINYLSYRGYIINPLTDLDYDPFNDPPLFGSPKSNYCSKLTFLHGISTLDDFSPFDGTRFEDLCEEYIKNAYLFTTRPEVRDFNTMLELLSSAYAESASRIYDLNEKTRVANKILIRKKLRNNVI